MDVAVAEAGKCLPNPLFRHIRTAYSWSCLGKNRRTSVNIGDVQKNPLTWLDTMLNAVEHMNFFEGRATEYSKASTQGSWTEAFA